MSLITNIDQDFQQALKKRDRLVVGTLRLLKSEIIKQEKNGKETTEELVLQILKSQIKQRKDSISEYQKANRQDLVDTEQAELDILEKYLPPGLSEGEVEAIVDEVLASLPDGESSNFGKVMGAVMQKAGSAADGNLVNKLVRDKLQ